MPICVAVHIYNRSSSRAASRDIAGMLRGLSNSYGGFRSVSGQTNARFLRGRPLRFQFSTPRKCASFRRGAMKWFRDDIEVRRLFRKC